MRNIIKYDEFTKTKDIKKVPSEGKEQNKGFIKYTFYSRMEGVLKLYFEFNFSE
jgi:hypothetical protein